ncbi:MAG: hypothetical protein ABIV50_03060 [Opitutus sp.]
MKSSHDQDLTAAVRQLGNRLLQQGSVGHPFSNCFERWRVYGSFSQKNFLDHVCLGSCTSAKYVERSVSSYDEKQLPHPAVYHAALP